MQRLYIQEVVTRDGFQAESSFIPSADKIALINRLSQAGYAKSEVTSFTSPKAIPMLADAEEVISVEAGVKADLWDNRARLGFSVFRYAVDNQQLNAVGGALNQTILLNADKTVGQGFEVDFDAYLTDALMVTFGASYNDTEIQDEDLAVAPLLLVVGLATLAV